MEAYPEVAALSNERVSPLPIRVESVMRVGHDLHELHQGLDETRRIGAVSVRSIVSAAIAPVFPGPVEPGVSCGESMYGKLILAAVSPVCEICEYPVKHDAGPRDQKARPVRRPIVRSYR